MAIRNPPEYNTQLSLFSNVFTDISTRDSQETMELPFLSLSKRTRLKPIEYQSENAKITVTGGAPYGIATIWDWDLVMWLLSQLREAIDRGEVPTRRIRFHPYKFFMAVRRNIGGIQYERFGQSLKRLKNTTVVTTVRAKREKTVMFSWLEYGEFERDEHGRIKYVTVVIPEWLFEAVSDKRLLLTINPDYFLLTGGIERWLYRLVRKQAGSNRRGWGWYFSTLHKRSGSTQRFSDFSTALRNVAAKGALLEYKLVMTKRSGHDYLSATRVSTKSFPLAEVALQNPLGLKTTTYEIAKQYLPSKDIYALEDAWKKSTARNKFDIKDPDQAFLDWCRKVAKNL